MNYPYRSLAKSERGFVGDHPTICLFEATLSGHLDVDTLGTAFAVLRGRHPALAARIGSSSTGEPCFAAPYIGSVAAEHVSVSRVDVLPTAAEPPRLDITRSLSALSVITDGHDHTVTLHIGHALADGMHGQAMLAELCSLYTYLMVGDDSDAVQATAPRPFPLSGEDVLDRYGVVADTDVSEPVDACLDAGVWHGVSVSGTEIDAPQWSFMWSHLLDIATSQRFVAACAAADISVFAAIAGAIVCAERHGFDGVDDSTALPLGVMTLVDLRRRMSPPLDPVAVTNFVAPSYRTIEVAVGDDTVAIGKALTRGVVDDIDSGRCLQALAGGDSDGGRRPDRHPPIVLSNMGRVPELELPPALVATYVRTGLWFDSSGLRRDDLGAGTPPAPLATVYQIGGYGGRLGVDMMNLPGIVRPDVTTRIGDEIAARLRSWADRSPIPSGGDDAFDAAFDEAKVGAHV